MARYVGTVSSEWDAERVFDYMADFRSAVEWDPTVVRTELLEGRPGEVGSKFEVIVKSLGRENRFVYETTEVERPDRFTLRAETGTLVSEDTVTVSRTSSQTLMTYDAELTLKGPLALFDPILTVFFQRIATSAAAGLRERLAS